MYDATFPSIQRQSLSLSLSLSLSHTFIYARHITRDSPIISLRRSFNVVLRRPRLLVDLETFTLMILCVAASLAG